MKSKPTRKNITPRPWWMLNEQTAPPVVALGVMLLVILFTLVFHTFLEKKDDPVTPSTNSTKESVLTITTDDGMALDADLFYPAGAGPFPVVILLHEFGQDRTEWNVYRDAFVAENYAVLPYDMRGFGKSALTAVPTDQATWFASMPNDLRAVVQYAQVQSKIDAEKIFVMGVGLGANVAYVGAGSISGIAKTILISPAINPQLDGTAVDNFFPTNVFSLANETERTIVETLLSRVNEEKSVEFVATPGVTGLQLLQSDEVQKTLFGWLRQ